MSLEQRWHYADQLLGENCEKHEGKSIDSFCTDHEELCCEVCVSSNHSSCNGRVTLSAALQEEVHKKFSHITLHELDKLKTDIEKHTISKSADRQRLDTEYEQSQKRVTEYRERLIDELDRLQKDFMKELQYRYDRDIDAVEIDIKSSEEMTEELNSVMRKLHSKEDNTMTSFIGIIRTKEIIKTFKEKLNTLSYDDWKKNLVYKIDQSVEQTVKACKSFGTFGSVENQERKPTNIKETAVKNSFHKAKEIKAFKDDEYGNIGAYGVNKDENLREIKYHDDKKVINQCIKQGIKLPRTSEDVDETIRKETKITEKDDNIGHRIYDHAGIIEGMALTESGQLILADSFNKSLKISHIKEPKDVQTIPLKDSPRDICIINEDALCISYKESHEVHIVTLYDNRVETIHAVRIGKVCLGVFYKKGKLYVTCGKGSKAEIRLYLIDESLSHVRFCCKFPRGKKLFVSPCCVNTSVDGYEIYVGDYHEGIKALQIDGTQIWTNNGDKILKGVWGMTVDENGNIYVTGHSTNNVVKVSADGTTCGVVVESLERPTAICYDSMTRMLLIVYDTNQLLLYKVDKQR